MNDQTPSKPAVARPKSAAGATGKTGVKTPRKKKHGSGFLNFLLLLAIIATLGLFVWAEMQRRDARNQLEQTKAELNEIRAASERDGDEVAQEVLGKVRELMRIQEDPEPTVATIVDVERLRGTNEFYDQAKNGDHLIITSRRAILYDPTENIIIDVVPVSVENNEASPQDDAPVNEAASGEGEPQGSPEPTVSPDASPVAESPSATPEL